MKGKVLAVSLLVMVGLALFFLGRPVQADVSPILEIENVFTALNSGEVDAALALFAEDATVENRVRGETYAGLSEIKQMLAGMSREGRRLDIVSYAMDGDTIIVEAEVSDRGVVWGKETVAVQLANGKVKAFHVTDFHLELWRNGK